ncbi:hypothetical protein JRO89_XS01G0029000 [Xanthoceras sorbifolium]|uniref:Uncharacterized protein n=1 Tax=Xanthoceras sorbifolium TaxID=99658 RepID=A0ABQ8IIS3_9ROSI|nr:hypothetical protein JRO89_XS01G0029000 [Xanthoceras sorbifolium]
MDLSASVNLIEDAQRQEDLVYQVALASDYDLWEDHQVLQLSNFDAHRRSPTEQSKQEWVSLRNAPNKYMGFCGIHFIYLSAAQQSMPLAQELPV